MIFKMDDAFARRTTEALERIAKSLESKSYNDYHDLEKEAKE